MVFVAAAGHRRLRHRRAAAAAGAGKGGGRRPEPGLQPQHRRLQSRQRARRLGRRRRHRARARPAGAGAGWRRCSRWPGSRSRSGAGHSIDGVRWPRTPPAPESPDPCTNIDKDAPWNTAISAARASRSRPSASAPAPSAAQGPLFSAWGNTDVAGARRIVDICLDAGVNLFDTRRCLFERRFRSDPRRGASRAGATRSPLDQARAARGATDRTMSAPRAIIWSGASMPRCGGSAPTPSTCCSCMPSTP